MTETLPFATALGDALRAARYGAGWSQRQLAKELGISKSAVGRMEKGQLGEAVALVVRILTHVGFEIDVVDRRPEEARVPREVTRRSDEELEEILDAWRHRVVDEGVVDAAGRRPPAHRHVYPLRGPHRWWVLRHPGVPWSQRPLWSFSAHVTWPHYVKRLGRYPPLIGTAPEGGFPMQGRPPAEALAVTSPPGVRWTW